MHSHISSRGKMSGISPMFGAVGSPCEHRQPHTPAARRALRAWTGHSSPGAKLDPELPCREHQYSPEHPASPLLSSNTSCAPFSPFWDISSCISGHISDPRPMQAICSQHTTADSRTAREAAGKHPRLPTWRRAFFNDSVLFTCAPSKWLTGFLWREVSLAGTTARLHSLYQQGHKLTQH